MQHCGIHIIWLFGFGYIDLRLSGGSQPDENLSILHMMLIHMDSESINYSKKFKKYEYLLCLSNHTLS
jgi:hypothetical protein